MIERRGLRIGCLIRKSVIPPWAEPAFKRVSEVWVTLLMLGGLAPLTISCDLAPPSFVELSTPRGSIDTLGPYAFTVRVAGAVDGVDVVWVRETPTHNDLDSAPSIENQSDQQRLALRRDGEVWVGAIEGGVPVATYRYFIEANGAGGSTREPFVGSDRFEVKALTGRCVTDSECLMGEVCHRDALYCFEAPERCEADFHCPRDQFCNLETGLCRFWDSGCTADEDCGANARCIDGVCTPDRPDPPPLFCDPPCADRERCEAGRCVPDLIECDPLCAPDELCTDGVCVPDMTVCSSDGMCPSGYACDLPNQRCIQGRRGSFCAPCGLESSEGNAECGVGFACHSDFPGCRPQCGSLGDDRLTCHGNEECVEGVCINLDFLGCYDAECSAHDDCSTNVCERGRCRDALICSGDEDCTAEETCSGGICVWRDPCPIGACPEEQICLGGRCTPIPEAPSTCRLCEADEECAPWEHCVLDIALDEFLCQKICDQDSQCGATQSCISEREFAYGYCLESTRSGCIASMPPLRCDVDSAAPNHTFNDAYVLEVAGDETTTTDTFFQCAYQDDYFLIERPSDVRYEVEWRSDGPSALYLLDADRRVLTEVPNVVPSPESISFELGDAVYMQVAGLEEVSYPYAFTFRPYAEMNNCEQDDVFEENDLLGDSYPIGAGAELSLTLCPQDEDWFTFRGAPGNIWGISWSLIDGPLQEIEISVGNADAFESGELSVNTTTESELNFVYVINQPTRYYIRIRCSSCSERINYQLQLSR